MPRPAPEYIPQHIRDHVAAQGKDFKNIAIENGLNPHRFYSFFAGQNTQLRPYFHLAQDLNVSLEKLLLIIDNDELDGLLERRAYDLAMPNRTSYCRHIKVSHSLIIKLISGTNKAEALREADSIARALQLTVDQLFSASLSVA